MKNNVTLAINPNFLWRHFRLSRPVVSGMCRWSYLSIGILNPLPD